MDGKQQSIVVPYACLFNFYADYANQTHWTYNSITKEFIITANRDIPRGSPI